MFSHFLAAIFLLLSPHSPPRRFLFFMSGYFFRGKTSASSWHEQNQNNWSFELFLGIIAPVQICSFWLGKKEIRCGRRGKKPLQKCMRHRDWHDQALDDKHRSHHQWLIPFRSPNMHPILILIQPTQITFFFFSHMTQFNEIRCDVSNCSIYSIPVCGKVNHSARNLSMLYHVVMYCRCAWGGGLDREEGGGS